MRDILGRTIQVGDVVYRPNTYGSSQWKIGIITGWTPSGNARFYIPYKSDKTIELISAGYLLTYTTSVIILDTLGDLENWKKDLINDKRKEFGLKPIK